MARVQLDATAFVRSGTAVSLQSGIQLNVYHRGTANLATGYTTETGSTTVTYPLSSNVEGQFTAWYPPGRYDLDSPSDTIAAPMAWDAVSSAGPDEFHVDQYGAVGDGTTDDSAAINAAVTAAAGLGVVKFGPKTYKLTTDAIRIPHSATGLTLQGSGVGATTILSGGASAGGVAHAFAFIRTADDNLFKNVTIQDLSINMNARADTRVYGVHTTELTTGTVQQKCNFEDITIRRLRIYGLTARLASSNWGVNLAIHQNADATPQNYARRITVQDIRVEGGNAGVTVTASTASPDVWHDEILVERVWHHPGSIMDSTWPSSGVQIGSYASGGHGTIRDCWVYGHGDVGYEINSYTRGLVENCWSVECNGNSFYHTNFSYPTVEGSGAPGSGNNSVANQIITFRDCHAISRTADVVAGQGHAFRHAPNNSIPTGELVYENCSYHRRGATSFGMAGEAILVGSTPGTDPTVRSVTVQGGRFDMQSISIPAGGGAATSSSALAFYAPINSLKVKDVWIRANATKDVAAAAHTFSGIELRSPNTDFDIDYADFDLSMTRMVVYGIRVGHSGTVGQNGNIRNPRISSLSDASSTWTFIDIGAGGALTTAGINIQNGHWNLLPAAATEVAIDATNRPVVVVDETNVINVANSVASAATITLPNGGPTLVDVTGTTNITSVTASWEGRVVILKFADVLTFTDGSNLVLSGNFVTSIGDTITLICNGTNWYEMARSAN
jgi:hypothetical protein